MATPSMIQALLGAQPPQVQPGMPMGAPPMPPPMPQPPTSVPQETRTALLGLLGQPSEGQSQGEAVSPSPVPAVTLERWGFDPMAATGQGSGGAR